MPFLLFQVFFSERFAIEAFFISIIGAAVAFAALEVARSADVVGALAVVRSALDGRAVMIRSAVGGPFFYFFLFGQAMIFHMESFSVSMR